MGRKCMVPDCLSEEGRYEDRGVTFHKIPLHSDIRPKWMSLCHIPEDKHNVKVVHVCSRHFLKADFCRFKGKKYMLRQGVLPSVFPWSKLPKKDTIGHPSNELAFPIKEEIKEPLDGTKIKEEPLEIDFNRKDTAFEGFTSAKMEINASGANEIKEEVGEMTTEALLSNIHNAVNLPSDNLNVEHKTSDVLKSSTTIEQKGKSIQTSSGVLNFAINTRLEALDFNNQMWFPARIMEVDYEESEVLIHFEKYSNKYDEWISMNSSRLRPIQPTPKKMETFEVGEKCLASWSDARKFPASITRVIDNDTYEVLFNDGLVKVLKAHRMAKAGGKVLGSSPLFDPAEGTKQERRDKKRKLNVAQLFRKRPRLENAEEAGTTSASSTLLSNTSAANALEESTNSPVEDPEMWMPRWENGKPIGTDSVIETTDGLRKSIIVADPRLPENWQKHLTQRIHGASAGKWDTIILNPDGRRFRTRTEIKTYLEENSHLGLSDSVFDFSLHRRQRASRRSVPAVEPSPVIEPVPEPVPEEEHSNSLKIHLIDDAYQCPIEGCGKNFRRENLAQMHVKHYHPEYTKFLDSTPNVADLAYARTVGESLDKSPDRSSKPIPLRLVQKTLTPKTPTAKISVSSPTVEAEKPLQINEPPSQPEKSKDSEILKLLNSKPQDDPSAKYPPGLPSNMYPDFKLKDLLKKSEGIPNREDLNLKSLSASTARPTGIKTLLPVVRPDKKDQTEKPAEKSTPDGEWVKTSTNKTHPSKQSVKRKRPASESVEPAKAAEPTPSTSVKQEAPAQQETNPNYIVEGGEVIKIVRMRQEEIINCTCGFTEEDGLMIQCELCLCWQHAYCNNIERENQVPDKYICYICQNPMRQRSSRKYFHDQDWLKNGTLPVAAYHCKDNEALKKRFEKLQKAHDLTGGLLELKNYMHSLKVKTKIAESKNHPKLYLWSKPWEKKALPEKASIKQEEEDKAKGSLESQACKSELDLLGGKSDSQGDSMLLSILKSAKEDQKLKEELDLNSLINSNLEQLSLPANVPQPEAAIESADCKINLLDHIAHCQTLVEERLNEFEAQVDALDAGSSNTEEDFSRTCQTIQMLLRDLTTIKELSQSNSL